MEMLIFILLLILAVSPYLIIYLVRKYDKKHQRIERRKLSKREIKKWLSELEEQEVEPFSDNELSELEGYESSAVMDLEDEEEADG